MNKPLTQAQQRKLEQLNNSVLQAQERLNDFIMYLHDEHDAPANEWQITDIGIGFVAQTPQVTEENGVG